MFFLFPCIFCMLLFILKHCERSFLCLSLEWCSLAKSDIDVLHKVLSSKLVLVVIEFHSGSLAFLDQALGHMPFVEAHLCDVKNGDWMFTDQSLPFLFHYFLFHLTVFFCQGEGGEAVWLGCLVWLGLLGGK